MRTQRNFSLLLAAAALAFAQVSATQAATAPSPTTTAVGAGGITIDYILPKYSFAPGNVTIWGSGLDTVTDVTLDGDPIPIVSQNATQMVVAPPAQAPGFPILRATNGVDHASRPAWLWPNLKARTTGLGGKVRISLANGGAGIFVLGYATERVSTPQVVLSPPTWYGCLLDMNIDAATLTTDVFLTAESRHLTYSVPDDPVLIGKTVYFQAWCQQFDTVPGPTWSFTNLGAVTF